MGAFLLIELQLNGYSIMAGLAPASPPPKNIAKV